MITIPVYYTQILKTKPNRTFLLSLNWYRNAPYFLQNTVKQSMTAIIVPQLIELPAMTGKYKVTYNYYYKNSASDLSNVGPLASKWLLDVAQSIGTVQQDNVKYLVQETYTVIAQDRDNPRIEATITPVKDDYVTNGKNRTRTKV